MPPSSPVIVKVMPTFGSTAGGSLMSVQGLGLARGNGRPHVLFGSVSVPAVCETTTQCTVRAPAHRRGTAPVSVVTTGGRSARSTSARFTFIAPTPTAPITTSIELDEATVAAGTPISASFVVDNPGAAVLVSGCPENSTITLSNSQLATGGASGGVGCTYVIEPGTTTVRITVPTTYQQCTQNPAQATAKSPSCPAPSLPAGTYSVTYRASFQVPAPAPVSVTLTS